MHFGNVRLATDLRFGSGEGVASIAFLLSCLFATGSSKTAIMSKEDLSGFAGALLCAAVGWYDEHWRNFWFGSGAILAVWTFWSLSKTGSSDE
jgi:hypothetical protein